MVEVLSKSSKNSRGNTMVCNYFLTGSTREWCVSVLPFSLLLLKPLNKNAFFLYKFDINQYAIIGYKFFRKRTSLETNFASTLLLLPYHIILFHQEQCFCSDVDVKKSFTYDCTRDEVYNQNENSTLDRETFPPLGWLWQETLLHAADVTFQFDIESYNIATN